MMTTEDYTALIVTMRKSNTLVITYYHPDWAAN